MRLAFVILGEPASKANSRELVTIRKRQPDGSVKASPRLRKSDKALDFERDALRQIPPRCRVQLTGPVCVTLRMFYATERPDLDESVVLDVLQDRWRSVKQRNGERIRELVQRGVYRNDRQVREKHVYHAIDRQRPRVEVIVEPMHAQQVELVLDGKEADPW
ncbi:hypothetical protein [Cupriavidus taiwanensis]|uniref:hypothetical protein n=1 Tax=Cupriavidus taiwanensis TaxID=164546 RepID=UPI000E13F823|nr:hypothetical protein [Cupriavidus taiwanensis]SPA17220.1 Endodeoxyribonuclease RusA [Cupriavidus taiwanensis]